MRCGSIPITVWKKLSRYPKARSINRPRTKRECDALWLRLKMRGFNTGRLRANLFQ